MDNRKRDKGINIRVSEDEKRIITRHAKKCRLTVSNYIRQLAVGKEPRQLPSDEFYDNCNRLQKVINECKDWELRKKLQDVKNDLVMLGFNDWEDDENGNDKNMARP